MGILADIINKKINSIVDRKINEQDTSEETTATTYNRLWLEKVSREAGYAISQNENIVNNILKALNKREGHCPCGGMTEDFICPCKMMRTYGTCKCGLYMDVKDIEPKDTKTIGKIKED